MNAECKELSYVVNGSGQAVVEGVSVDLATGDMILIDAGEKYHYDGNLTLFVSCTPAWYPEQHSNIK
jgi:mannose-6-phosphate isomerase-like protein (cupin superfamily)